MTNVVNYPHLLNLKLHVQTFHQLYGEEGLIHDAFVNATSPECVCYIFVPKCMLRNAMLP